MVDVRVELGHVLEEVDHFVVGLLVHVHAAQNAVFARGALEVPRVEEFLLAAGVQGGPGGVGFGQAVLLPGKRLFAVDLLVAFRRAEGGVGHAELHVAVVPRLVLARRVAAEVDLEAGTLAVVGGQCADEALAEMELDGLARENGRCRKRAAACAVCAGGIVGVALDLVDVSLGGRGVDEVDERATRAKVGDTLGVCQDGGEEREEDGDSREECE